MAECRVGWKPVSVHPTTGSTDTRTPSELAREIFRVVFDERDLSDPYRFWSDESVNHFLAAGQSVRGAEALAQWFQQLLEAVPDWRIEIENSFDDGDRQAVVQWRGSGTLTGEPFMGIEPNGRRIEFRGIDVFRFGEDGKVATNTIYYDGAEFARQIGMLPPRDSALDRGMLAAFNAGTRLKQRLKRR
jgi:steroid delta-isomerase-like uncharacterized protein